MRLYFIFGTGRLDTSRGITWDWDNNISPTVPVHIHPDIDFYWITGEALLRNKKVNFKEPDMEMKGPCFLLARNGFDAEKYVRKSKQ